LAAGFYIYGAIIAFSMTTALLYHLNHERKYLTVDVVASTILILTNLYFAYLSNFKFPYFHLAIVSLIISFYFWLRAQKTSYNFNHSMWHVASVMITIFCLLTYLR